MFLIFLSLGILSYVRAAVGKKPDEEEVVRNPEAQVCRDLEEEFGKDPESEITSGFSTAVCANFPGIPAA